MSDLSQKQLTSDGGFMPNLSPDGKWLAYTVFGSTGFNIAKISIDGGQATTVTDKFARFPSVSPDGKLIACYYADRPTNSDKVGLLNSDNGEPVKLIDLPRSAERLHLLVWSADGRGVAYIDTRGDVSNIWLQPIDGSPPKQLTEFKNDRIFSFGWSHDGRWLAYSRGTDEHDVVLITDFQ